MRKICLPYQGNEIIPQSIDDIAFLYNIEKSIDLTGFQSLIEPDLADSIPEEKKGQTLFGIDAFINDLIMVNDLAFLDLDREEVEFVEKTGKSG